MRTSFDVRDADADTLSRPDLRPVTMVSADSHVSLPPKMYKHYLDSKYHNSWSGYLDDVAIINKVVELTGYPAPEDALAIYDKRGVVSAAGEVGYFDPVWRLRHVEAEGIAAEFLHPFGPIGFVPFVDVQNSLRSHELRLAGAHAHNRFLDDFCSEAPGRLLGVPLIYPWPDWDAGVADIVRARESGFHAIFPPMMPGTSPDDLPALYDSWWDPMWAACQDLGMVVHIHAGFGNPQGGVVEMVRNVFGRTESLDGPDNEGKKGLAVIDPSLLPKFDPDADPDAAGTNSFLSELFETFGERRPLWQLMWGGVFDRFPKLKVAFQEIHADWVPATLAYLDRAHAANPGPLELTPSEYWARHCAVGTSLMRYGDVAVRHEVGLNKMMFGSDFPHFEGTWPNTHDWIRTTLGSVPEVEARAILGENAIDFYGLDRALLEKTAKRVGPLPGELFNSQPVDPKLIRHFEFRAGINKPVNFNVDQMNQAFEEDRAGATKALAATGKSA
jgi:predicted TIM-barrel fold metal-dependent hydrolase